MINPTSASEQLIFSTVRIEVTKQDGSMGMGTAFFFMFEFEHGRRIHALITNKHVIKDAIFGSFKVHEAIQTGDKLYPSGRSFSVGFQNFESQWFMHPDPHVDLCAMPTKPLLSEAEAQGKIIYLKHMSKSIIPSQEKLEELRAVENIVMIGYPQGLWDEVNNLPIVRRGITATHPAIDYNGLPACVIDMACFPGSSGSPVLVLEEGSYVDKNGWIAVGQSRVILIGVLYAGPQYLAEGEVAIKNSPTAKKKLSQTPVSMHLGFVVKAREILSLGEALWRFSTTDGGNTP